MPIEKDLSRYAGSLPGYSELRAQENRTLRLSMLNGNLVQNALAVQGGISARVYRNGLYGMASNPEMDEAAVRGVLRDAAYNAEFLSGKSKQAGAKFAPSCSGGTFVRPERPTMSVKDRLDAFQALDEALVKMPNLTSRSISFMSLDVEKTLVTSDGAHLHSYLPNETFYLNLSAQRDSGEPVEIFELYDAFTIADFLADREKVLAFAQSVYDTLMKKREGVYADAGYKDCVLDARLGGMLAHEAIGHTVEADFVQAGSVAADYMDKVVASPLVSIVDFAHTALGETCPSPVYVDDEGTQAVDAVLIENGVLRSYMHDKESAAKMGYAPQGNARGFLFSDEPLIRMRNTAILPGTDKLPAMIESIEDGYYLINTGNGQADSTSEFTFGITQGFEIKNGKLGRALLDTTVSGVAFDMLKTVSMVSDTMYWTAAGYCGKKQPMKVGMGGPAIKCKIMVGGK